MHAFGVNVINNKQTIRNLYHINSLVNMVPTSTNIELLLRDYRQAAVKQGKATLDGDYRTANRQHAIIARVYRELRTRGREAQNHLLEFLNDPDPNVRLWAASHGLEFAPEIAEPVLEELSHARGLVAFNAELTLGEWRKGDLQFP